MIVVGGFLVDALINRRFFLRRASLLLVDISRGLTSVKDGIGMSGDRLVLRAKGWGVEIVEMGFINGGALIGWVGSEIVSSRGLDGTSRGAAVAEHWSISLGMVGLIRDTAIKGSVNNKRWRFEYFI